MEPHSTPIDGDVSSQSLEETHGHALDVEFLDFDDADYDCNVIPPPYNDDSEDSHLACNIKKSNKEHVNKNIDNLQLQVKKLESKVDNIGDNHQELRNSQESVSTTLYTVLSSLSREKHNIFDQYVSSNILCYLQDTYSFIMVDPLSISALVAWFVFFVQMGCFLLVVSKYFFTSNFTSLQVTFPKGVDRSVSAAQCVTIFLILLVQQALWESMSGFSNGFTDEFESFGIKRSWWFMSLSLRLLEGLVASFVTFWFVLQSDDVLDLFKDFTAITFVSSLDNIVFVLAGMGILGSSMEDAVDKCNIYSKRAQRIDSKRFKGSIKLLSSGRLRYLLLHPLFFALALLTAMYIIWADIVYIPQVNGRSICQQLYLQLDDDVNFHLSYFSGSYEKLEGKDKRGWYPAYREMTTFKQKNKLLERKMILRFCENMNSWVFTFERKNFEQECLEKHALVQNANVENQHKFDLREVSDSDWIVRDPNIDKWIPLKNFVVDCEDEGPKYDWNENPTCKSLVVDEREEVFLSSRLWSNNFTIMEKGSEYMTVYNHPVYTNDINNSGREQELIVFLGKRWAMLSTNDLKNYNENKTDLFSYFATNFHGRWSDYTVAFFSEPVTSDTTKDTMTPVGLSWVMASPKIIGQNQQADVSRKKSSIFLCGECDNETNPCFYEGSCLPSKTCLCTTNSTGALCQVLPTNNGHCNEHFNKREYNFDGGDCCEHTCMSGETFQCGRDESGLFYVGYDMCSIDTCTECLRQSLPSPNMKSLIVTDLSLTSSGRVLGLIEPVGKTARVYDNDGSAWVMRGSVIMTINEPSSSMIQVVGREDILQNEDIFSPITVVIKTNDEVYVFDWSNTLWSGCDSSIFNKVSSSPMQLELDNKGNIMGVLYNDNLFRLFKRDHWSLPWNDISTRLNSSHKYKFLSISKDANKIALSNDTCFELHDLLKNSINTNCGMKESCEIKTIALSPNGQNLGVLVEKGSEGEVVVFNVENNTFLESGNALRGVSVENAKIEVSNDGTTVTSHSGINNVVLINKYLKDKWQLIDSMPSKSMSLSSNQKVLATISPITSFAAIFHRTILCEEGYSRVRLTFITDDHPNELMWEILNITASGDIHILKKGGPYEIAQAMIVEDFCVENHVINNTDLDGGNCIGLRVRDLGRDGLKSPGKIGLSINGTMIRTMDETDGYDIVYGVVGNMDLLKFVKEDLPWPHKYNPSVHMECFAIKCEWNRIGSVNRSSPCYWGGLFDYSRFLSMSADGLVVSIGDHSNNRVEMLKYNGNSGWTPHGTNNIITGQDDNVEFGWSTSVSADGSIVAIGDPGAKVNDRWSGQVRLYALNKTDNNWYQLGNALNGTHFRNRFGNTISLSADGSVFAAGSYVAWDRRLEKCVYEFSPIMEEWIQRGRIPFDEFSEGSYVHVTLSSTGLIVAVAYRDELTYAGLVQVYEYNPLNNEWIQLGNDIQGDIQGMWHNLGSSMAMSSDGSILAVAGRTAFPAKTYTFDIDKNDWQQMGTDISSSGCPDFYSYYGLSLSADGSVCVLSYCGALQVFTYDKTTNEWKESVTRSPSVEYSCYISFSLVASSADALTVATKGDYVVEIHRLSQNLLLNKTCNGNEFTFTIQPDRFPGDISWFLQDQAGDVVIGGKLPNDGIDQQNGFNYTKCLPNNSMVFYFYIQDEYGDGICCDWGDGNFTLKWNNDIVMKEDNFKSYESMCLPRSSNLVPMSLHVYNFRYESDLLVLDVNGNTLLSRNGHSGAGENVRLYQCVPSNACFKIALLNIEKVSVYFNDSINQTIFPTTNLEIFQIGDCDFPSCPQNQSFLEIYFATDDQPEEFSWKLFHWNNEILMSEDDYTINYNIYHYRRCVEVSQNHCAILKLYDQFHNGGNYYYVLWNGNTIKNGTYYRQIDISLCGVLTCPQNQSLFEIFWQENLYFFWELLDPLNNTLISGGNHNQTSHYRACVSIRRDYCGILLLYERTKNIFRPKYRVMWNSDEVLDAILVGSFDRISLGNCNIGDVCPENYSLFNMLIQTDNRPDEFSWELFNSDDIILYDGKYYSERYKEYHHQGCVAVSQNECVTLMLYDSWGNGGTHYEVSWNMNTVANDTQGNHDLDFKMGSCDANN